MKKIVTSQTAPPTGDYPLSHAVEVNGFLYTSGQTYADENLQLVGETTEEKATNTMENLRSIIEAAGMTFDNVIKTTIYVTDMSIYADLNNVYAAYFDRDFPAREVVCVKALPLGASIEISMVAAR